MKVARWRKLGNEEHHNM